jgi:hypothetical protein
MRGEYRKTFLKSYNNKKTNIYLIVDSNERD